MFHEISPSCIDQLFLFNKQFNIKIKKINAGEIYFS